MPAAPQFSRDREKRDDVPARAATSHKKDRRGDGATGRRGDSDTGISESGGSPRLPVSPSPRQFLLPVAASHQPTCSDIFIRIPKDASVLSSELPAALIIGSGMPFVGIMPSTEVMFMSP